MTLDLLTTSEVKQQIAKRFDEGWMLLFDDINGLLLTAIKNMYYTGKKESGFETLALTTKDKKVCSLCLVKKEHYPFNKDTKNIDNIKGIVIAFNGGDGKLKAIRSGTVDEILKAGGVEL